MCGHLWASLYIRVPITCDHQNFAPSPFHRRLKALLGLWVRHKCRPNDLALSHSLPPHIGPRFINLFQSSTTTVLHVFRVRHLMSLKGFGFVPAFKRAPHAHKFLVLVMNDHDGYLWVRPIYLHLEAICRQLTIAQVSGPLKLHSSLKGSKIFQRDNWIL